MTNETEKKEDRDPIYDESGFQIGWADKLIDKSVYKEGYRAVEEAMGHPSPEFWVERDYDRRD